MHHRLSYRKLTYSLTLLGCLGACESGLDMDLRGLSGGFTTAPQAQNASIAPPSPDALGLVSYPNYQVAVARRGETVEQIAQRLGLDAPELGRQNGLAVDTALRNGEIIALPENANLAIAQDAPSAAQDAAPAQAVDVTALAGQAIRRTDPGPAAQQVASSPEPLRHKVMRGESAFSIARLYNIPVRTLAQWNGLGAQFDIREGQYLLIPIIPQAPKQTRAPTAPGQGSVAPLPPSSSAPLPQDVAVKPAPSQQAVVDIGTSTKAPKEGRFAYPVQGTIIRDYAKGRSDGISIKASPGSPVKAAAKGTVAAITQSAEGVPIIVVRHEGNLLTVYANVTDVAVQKGASLRKGQNIAKLREGENAYIHFEVRDGFDSVDPNLYLNG
jgi:murein DD-endopeptidase MepM/ murein hydrolase activator NlpD